MEARPLRVAVVARAVMPLHGVGGLEQSVHDLVHQLAARGVEVTLIVPPPRAGADRAPWPGVRLDFVPYLTFPLANRRGTTVIDRSTAYLLYGWRAGRRARALADRGAVDVIHGFGASLLGAVDPGTRPVPLVLNPQGLEEFGATARHQPIAKRVGYAPLRWAVRRVARAADRIIATDEALRPTVVRHLAPRDGQLVTIPNGIDLPRVIALGTPEDGAALRARHGLGTDLVLLSVGRLEFNKGLDVLAVALGRLQKGVLGGRPWRWVIVGDGPYRDEIARAIRASGIEAHVHLTGRVDEASLHAWYEAATIFVHPTRYEGSSLVTLEAMAHRRPIVATRAGGLPDKVTPGTNGWLVEPEDVTGLARAVEDAVSDAGRLAAMGERSRAIVERDFAWDVLIDRQLAMYRELLA